MSELTGVKIPDAEHEPVGVVSIFKVSRAAHIIVKPYKGESIAKPPEDMGYISGGKYVFIWNDRGFSVSSFFVIGMYKYCDDGDNECVDNTANQKWDVPVNGRRNYKADACH